MLIMNSSHFVFCAMAEATGVEAVGLFGPQASRLKPVLVTGFLAASTLTSYISIPLVLGSPVGAC